MSQIPTLGGSLDHDWVPVSAAVVYPRVDVGPGVASHLLSLDLKQHVLKHGTQIYRKKSYFARTIGIIPGRARSGWENRKLRGVEWIYHD